MPDLKTTYMGIPLRSPIVVGASSVSGDGGQDQDG